MRIGPLAAKLPEIPRVGIVGFGAFGQLMARELRPHAALLAWDPATGLDAAADRHGVRLAPLVEVARCAVVVLAVPVSRLAEAVAAVAPHLRPGALVLDVGSVKVGPAAILDRGLPAHVRIVATHPLFGPESARDGVAGLKIAVCPVRGPGALRLAAFLRSRLRLEVILTTPDAHDREMATAQGLTHLIARALVQMDPLPSRMTTRSFDHLVAAIDMVRNDAPEVYEAIERANPYAAEVRARFFSLMTALEADLAPHVERVA